MGPAVRALLTGGFGGGCRGGGCGGGREGARRDGRRGDCRGGRLGEHGTVVGAPAEVAAEAVMEAAT